MVGQLLLVFMVSSYQSLKLATYPTVFSREKGSEGMVGNLLSVFKVINLPYSLQQREGVGEHDGEPRHVQSVLAEQPEHLHINSKCMDGNRIVNRDQTKT